MTAFLRAALGIGMVFLAAQGNSQTKSPADLGFRHLTFRYRTDTVHILVLSKKGEETARKPLFLFVQGSLPSPALKYTDEGLLNPFGFNAWNHLDRYHIVFINKPGVPVVSPAETLQPDFTYRDPQTGLAPRAYCERNYLDYYVDRNNAALKFLTKQPWVDRRKVVVAGHSEGSTVAAKMALESKKITHLIYLAGNPAGRILTILSQKRKRETAQKPSADNEFAYWEYVLHDPSNDDCSQGDSNKATYSFSLPAKEYLEKLKIPVLVGYGTADYSTPFNDYLRIDLMRKKRTNFTFKPYVGMEHNFFGLKESGEVDYSNYNWDKVAVDFFDWLEKK